MFASLRVRDITVFTVFRLLTDFFCLHTYEFWLSLRKIVRSSVICYCPYLSDIGDLSLFLLSSLGPLISFLTTTFKLQAYPIFRLWPYLMQGYSRNSSWLLNLISTCLLLSLFRYFCWWTISIWQYHPYINQCFGAYICIIKLYSSLIL